MTSEIRKLKHTMHSEIQRWLDYWDYLDGNFWGLCNWRSDGEGLGRDERAVTRSDTIVDKAATVAVCVRGVRKK